MLSAKYSNGAPDDEQMLHVDYGNHTLVVPRPEVGYQHLELFVYLSDVTAERAATRMVSRHLTTGIPTERTYLSPAEYDDLYRAEVPASGPAGSILAYRPDVYHRGVRMTAPDSARFMLHVSFKPKDTDWLGSQAWPGACRRRGLAPLHAADERAAAHRAGLSRTGPPVLDRGDVARGGGALSAARPGAVAAGGTDRRTSR